MSEILDILKDASLIAVCFVLGSACWGGIKRLWRGRKSRRVELFAGPETLRTVHDVMVRRGMNNFDAEQAILEMQNRGIYFREARGKGKGD